MQVIGASKVFICDEKFSIIENGAIAFDEKIVEIGDYATLEKKYTKGDFYKDCVLLPSFVNPHIHFEFSNNTSDFLYGGFDKWLDSVMQQRDKVLSNNTQAIQNAINEQLASGVGSVGAISSYGDDRFALAKSPLKVVFFNEVIGSNPSAIDFLFSNFLQRLEASKELASSTFFPAIALHSPYSVHYILAKKVLSLAKAQNLPTSVHFLESKEERQWLEDSKGYFKNFYEKTLHIKDPKSLYSIEEFIELFQDMDTLFVHCLEANEKEIKQLMQSGNIVTCPKSNRLLNNKFLNLDSIDMTKLSIATDGKSSNNNLDYLDELRTALFGYSNKNCVDFAQTLLLNATLYGSKALRLNNGCLNENFDADFCLFEIPDIQHSHQSALQFILHAKQAKQVFINGKNVFNA